MEEDNSSVVMEGVDCADPNVFSPDPESHGDATPSSSEPPTDTSEEVTEAPPTPPPDPKPVKASKKAAKDKLAASAEPSAGKGKANKSPKQAKKRKADTLANGDINEKKSGGQSPRRAGKKAEKTDAKPKAKKAKKTVENNTGKDEVENDKEHVVENVENDKEPSNKKTPKAKRKYVKKSKKESTEDNNVETLENGESTTNIDTPKEVKEATKPKKKKAKSVKQVPSNDSEPMDTQPSDAISKGDDAHPQTDVDKNQHASPLPDNQSPQKQQPHSASTSPSKSPAASLSSKDSEESGADSGDEPQDSTANASNVTPLSRLESLTGEDLTEPTGLIGVPQVGRPEDLLKQQQEEEEDNGDPPYHWPECSYKARKKGQLRKHLAVHNIFNCAHCEFSSESREELQGHMRDNHPSRCGRKLCKKCNVLFLIDDLEEHEKDCTGEKKGWRCPECGKEFKFVCAMKSHIRRWHTDEGKKAAKRFQCEQCDYKATFMRDLKAHINSTHNENRIKAVKCPECENVYYSKDDVKQHVRECHSKERPYICDLCQKAFKTKTHLKNHLNTHNPSDTFKCDFEGCTSTFKADKYLERHRVEVHKLPPRRHRTKYPCPNEGCTEVFQQKSHLKRHMVTHTGEKNFHCDWPDCGKSFGHAENLQIHMRRHTNEKPLQCELCDNSYRQRSGLKYHMLKVHGINIVASKPAPAKAKQGTNEGEEAKENEGGSGDMLEKTNAVVPEASTNTEAQPAPPERKDVYDFNDSDDDDIDIQIRNVSPVKSPRIPDDPALLPPLEPEEPAKPAKKSKAKSKKGKKPKAAETEAAGDSTETPVKKAKGKAKKKAKSKAAKTSEETQVTEDEGEEGKDKEVSKEKEVSKPEKKSKKKKAKKAADTTAEAEDESASTKGKKKKAKKKTEKGAKTGANKTKKKKKKPASKKTEEVKEDTESQTESGVADKLLESPVSQLSEETDVTKMAMPYVAEQESPGSSPPRSSSPAASEERMEEDEQRDDQQQDEHQDSPMPPELTQEAYPDNPPSPPQEMPTSPAQDASSSPVPSPSSSSRSEATNDDRSNINFASDPYEMPGAPRPPPMVSDEEDDMPEDDLPPAQEVPVIVSQQQHQGYSSDRPPEGVADHLSDMQSPSGVPQTPTERPSMEYPMQTPNSEPYSVPPPSYGERRSSYGTEITSPLERSDGATKPGGGDLQSSSDNYGYPDSSASYPGPGSYPSQPQTVGLPPGSVEGPPDMHINSVPPPMSNDPDTSYPNQPSVSQAPPTDTYPPSLPPTTTTSYPSAPGDYPHPHEDSTTDSSRQPAHNDPIYMPSRSTESELAASRSVPPTTTVSSFGSDTFPSTRDFFGQYFQDPNTLPLTHPPMSQDPQRSALPPYQQQSTLSALQRSNADFLRRASSLMPGAGSYPSVTESLMALPQAPSQQHWPPGMYTDERSRHLGQPSPMIMPSETDIASPLTRNPYTSNDYPSFDPSSSKRPESSFPVPPQTTTSSSTDRYGDLTSAYMSHSRTFNPTAPGASYGRSVAGAAAAASTQKFEEVYRHATAHISDYRSAITQPPPPPMPDMYSRMGMAGMAGLDKYYYPRDMYRSQHSLSAAPNPFMPPTSSTQMGTYGERDYARNMYPHNAAAGAYGAFMSDKQYKVPQPGMPTAPPTVPGAEYLQPPTGAPTDPHIQDPYRRSVLYNMVPRYF